MIHMFFIDTRHPTESLTNLLILEHNGRDIKVVQGHRFQDVSIPLFPWFINVNQARSRRLYVISSLCAHILIIP